MKRSPTSKDEAQRNIRSLLDQCTDLKADDKDVCRKCLHKLEQAYQTYSKLPPDETLMDLLYRLLRCNFLIGEYAKSRDYLNQYFSHTEQGIQHSLTGMAYNVSGRLHWVQNEFQSAVDDYLLGLPYYKDSNELMETAGLQQNIGTLYHLLGEIDLSIEHINAAIEGFRKIGSTNNEYFAKSNLANILISQGRFNDALALKLETIEFYKAAGHLKQLAMDLSSLGFIYKESGQLTKAIEYTLESLKIKESLNDIAGIAIAWLNLGAYCKELGDVNNSLVYYQKALKIGEEQQDLSMVAKLLNNIGNILKDKGEYKSALEHTLRALELSAQIGDLETEAIACQNIGLTKGNHLDDLPGALEYLNRSMKLAQKLANPMLQATLLFNLANTQMSTKNLTQAKQNLDEAAKTISNNELHVLNRDLYYYSAMYHSHKKDTPAALKFIELFAEQIRSDQHKENVAKIAEMQAIYETEKLARETDLLRSKNNELQEKNQQIENQKLQLQITLDKLRQSEIKYDFVSEVLTRGVRSTLIGKSETIRNITEMIGMVARSEKTHVLITGETGTGKEIVARNIHTLSNRGKQHFYAVNCSAVPDTLFESQFFGHEKDAFTGAIATKIGWFEIADKSTLFLDEISSMSLEQQSKLLRVLEERNIVRVGSHKEIPIDIRLISATNTNLIEDVNNERFRRDLYHRLAIFVINIPPLRERRDEIPLLFEHFVGIASAAMNKKITKIEKNILSSLMDYDFPGNVRELKNMVERAVLVADSSTLRLQHFIIPISSSQQASKLLTLEEMERCTILRALQTTGFNRTQAAKLLGVERKVVERKISKYKITEQDI